MSDISQRLRIAREHAGLSQGQVAKMLNLHRPTISEIEAGRRRVTSEEIVEFAKIYEVSVSWLTEEKEDDEIDERVKLAARDLTKLKSSDLDKVLKLLSRMRDSQEDD